ncbi:MAG TPA: polysaccharide lyase 6 family protein, partial [Armatimonadaceae bacterium]|nr:polysaccharide lyase 6 family protein [Armatimonadaceae bacterium]
VMADGIWKDQAIVFRGAGTAEKPITLRARTPGKAVLTGASTVTIDGDYLVARGLYVKDGHGEGKDAVALRGRHCRLTESAVVDSRYKFDVHLYGENNRLDHCYLAGKTSDSPTVQVEVGERPNNHRIDHNHFGPRPPLGRNGGETLRVGYSGQSMRDSRTLVEQNLFDRCDGELEIISSKSCKNVYRFNTFLESAGMLTLRHGNRCRVEGNVFLGRHKKGSGGVRIIGDDHVIVGNYIDGVDKGAFWITAGIPNSPLAGYFPARNALVAFNTVVDSKGPYLDLNAGFGTSNRSLRPEKITIANNLFLLFLLPEGGTLLKGEEGSGFRWVGNLADGPAGATLPEHAGIRIADPKLTRGEDGLWHPAPDSPAIGAAEGGFPLVTSRTSGITGIRADVGSRQSHGRLLNWRSRPLSVADVGPPWMKLR